MTAHEVSITITAEDRFTAALGEARENLDRFTAAMERSGRIAPPRDVSAVLADIDTATTPVCAQCDGPLGDSPSDDFCRPSCQERWHALRSVALTNYREPLLDWATLGPYSADFEGPRPARGSAVTEQSVPACVVLAANDALTRTIPPQCLVWLTPEATIRRLRRCRRAGRYAYRDDASGEVVAWGPVMYR